MSREHRLPDGTWTTDIDLFVAEWDKIRKPFEALGLRVIGFDPGIELCDKKTTDGSFDIPLYVAKRIIEAMSSNAPRLPDERSEDRQHADVGAQP